MVQINQRSVNALREAVRRNTDSLELFRPWSDPDPMQSQEAFFLDKTRQIGVFGGNQSSKSTICAVRFAAIARDKPITFNDGRKVDLRLSHQKGRPLLMWIIGFDLTHIGQTIYPMLFLPGHFKLIRDKRTGLLRSWNPRDPEDKARELETEPAPALIPEYKIEAESWTRKANCEFDLFTLENGTRIVGMSSRQKAKQGDRVDEIWIDEQVYDPKHYDEWLMRIMTNKGRIVWSSWPTENANEALQNLYDAADRQADKPNPTVRRYCFPQSKNPFIPAESREEILESGMLTEDALAARDLGLFLTDSRRIYPLFSKKIHRLLPEDEQVDDVLAKVVRKTGDIPANWTRYLILDPGTNHPAILCMAVPPPIVVHYKDGKEIKDKIPPFVIAYDELYPGRKDANQLARLAKDRWNGHAFEKFWIDANAERQTTMGFDMTVGDNYERAFAAVGLRCRATGSNFTPASNNVLGGIETVRGWMSVRDDGTTKFRIWVERCPNLVKQLLSYKKKIDPKGGVCEEPADYQQCDLADCLRYAATRRPTFVLREEMPTYASEWEHLAALFPKAKTGDYVNCGPGAA